MKVHYIAGVGYESNVYLLEDEDPIIVDTGAGMYADTALEEVSKIVPLRKVERIVLTHSHLDQMGGAEAFQKATGGRLYLHEAEEAPLKAGDSTYLLRNMFDMRLGKLDIAPLKAGEKLKLGEGELEVLHTPGHSPGSIVLLDRPASSAVVGDTVFCDGGVGRWDLPGGDLAQLMRSIKRLAELGLKNMYPGHGSYAEGDAQQHLRLSANYIEEAY
jgi:glyoxylase-like metal-dependent hydrolase (beta-lactamase superfamily II)